MKNQEQWIPESTPLDKPNAARMYDYFLGGYHNLEVDRLATAKSLEIYPDTKIGIQSSRAFLRRAVRFMCAQGIDQFLDIGSGIPTVGNVHEVAQEANPSTRIVYVDIDPVAVGHSRAMLVDNPLAVAIQADARDSDHILNHADVRRLIDFTKPVGVLFLCLLHFINDFAEAHGVVRAFRESVATGSYIAISHAISDALPRDVVERLQAIYAGTTNPGGFRTGAEVEQFFEGLEVVEPGLVLAPLWRPEGPDDIALNEPERTASLVGVGRVVAEER